MNWYIGVFRKYAQFGGRARRKEYWMFFLFNFLVGAVLGGVAGYVGGVVSNVVSPIYFLAVLVPAIAVAVRRMHDSGRSGWWILLPVANLVFLCQDSEAGENKYGPNPKNAEPASRAAHAPTLGLKEAYQKNLEDLRPASESWPGMLGEATDLSAAQPMQGVNGRPERSGGESLPPPQRTQRGWGLSPPVLIASGLAVVFASLSSFLLWQRFASPPVVSNVGISPAPSPASAATPATLLVVTDLACDWSLDGTPQVRIVSGKAAKVAVSLGKHLINATTVDGTDNLETIVEASRPQQEILKLDLNAVRADRQRRAAAEATRQRQAAADATRQLQAIIGGLPTNAPPPPAVQPKPVELNPQRVGGNVMQASLIRQPKPVYPPLAKAARVQGTVKFEAQIAKDGTIQNLHLLSGPPLLVQAAMQAVQQWQYKPTLLHGEPVEVITTIDVNFTLSQ